MVPAFTGVGAVRSGLHEGDAVAERQSPPVHASCALLQLPVHCAKQNEPVDVLTQLLPKGQVLWSAGLHAAVQAPPGNSGLETGLAPTQISPGPVHCAFVVQGFPRSGLDGRPCAGQFAAGMHAPNPGQQV
ncbi:MAG TPA: hypothetical protein VG496_17185 [Myxococcales bacterium]|nr:hypothetical protein [Myxococcales bacterium]